VNSATVRRQVLTAVFSCIADSCQRRPRAGSAMPCQSHLISNSHGAGTLAAWPAEMPGWVIDGSDRNEQGGWVKDGVRRPEKTHAFTQEGVKGLKRRQFGPPLPVQPVYYPPLAGSHEKRTVTFRRIPTAVVNVPDSVHHLRRLPTQQLLLIFRHGHGDPRFQLH